VSAQPEAVAASPAFAQGYEFNGGYPTPETVRQAYDDLDLIRALQMYRIFYPTVSGAAMFKGNAAVGVFPNRSFGTMDTRPKHVGYTLNSDTPYGAILLDLSVGPLVVELPAGPLLGAADLARASWFMLTFADHESASTARPTRRGSLPSGVNQCRRC
jgi:hypothetical protein